jgi:hypothetical protein
MSRKLTDAGQILDKIHEIENAYAHVLEAKGATVFENAPVAILQVEATSKLDALYWVIGERRPRFKCDAGGRVSDKRGD